MTGVRFFRVVGNVGVEALHGIFLLHSKYLHVNVGAISGRAFNSSAGFVINSLSITGQCQNWVHCLRDSLYHTLGLVECQMCVLMHDFRFADALAEVDSSYRARLSGVTGRLRQTGGKNGSRKRRYEINT